MKNCSYYNNCNYGDCDKCKHNDCLPYNHCPPKPVPGSSPMEICNNLYKQMHSMQCEFKQAMNEVDGLIKRAENKSIYNGAYYDGSVTVEEGYYTPESTAYKIIRIPHKDKCGCPIKLNLHLAYGNTTNSLINESIFNASEFELADKMVTAYNGDNENGWGGLAIYNNAPIKSHLDTALYTMGFDKCNKLHWYRNTTDMKQLQRDCIVNSMGVQGILVSGRIPTGSEMWGYDTVNNKTSRIVMGQCSATKDIYILVVGDYDKINNITNGKETGLTPNGAADIMCGYVDTAISVCYGGGDFGASAVDKGEMLFTPSNSVVQNNYAMWYISRKESFNNNYTFESATLRQLYGQLKWYYDLELSGIEVLINRLQNVEEEIALIDTELKSNDIRIVELEVFKNKVTNEIKIINNALSDLSTTVNDLVDFMNNTSIDIGKVQSQVNVLDKAVLDLNALIQRYMSETMLEFTEIKKQFIDISSEFILLKEYISDLNVLDINERITKEIVDRKDADAELLKKIYEFGGIKIKYYVGTEIALQYIKNPIVGDLAIVKSHTVVGVTAPALFAYENNISQGGTQQTAWFFITHLSVDLGLEDYYTKSEIDSALNGFNDSNDNAHAVIVNRIEREEEVRARDVETVNDNLNILTNLLDTEVNDRITSITETDTAIRVELNELEEKISNIPTTAPTGSRNFMQINEQLKYFMSDTDRIIIQMMKNNGEVSVTTISDDMSDEIVIVYHALGDSGSETMVIEGNSLTIPALFRSANIYIYNKDGGIKGEVALIKQQLNTVLFSTFTLYK